MAVRQYAGKNTGGVVILTVLVFAAVAVVTGILSGRLYAGVKTPSDRVAVVSHVCSQQDIEKLNQLAGSPTESDWPALLNDITAKPGYAKDPNCVYIAYQYALRAKDDAVITSSLSTLKALNEKGIYASGSITSLTGIEQLESMQVMYKTRTVPADGQIQGEG